MTLHKTIKNREFVRQTSHKITDTDIQDLKRGAVSVLVVHSIPLSTEDLLKQLNRIGEFQRQDISGDFVSTQTINQASKGIPWHTDRSYHPHPPQFVVLYASSAPKKEAGGETLYCDMQKAYQDLPEKTMKEINELQLLHFNKYIPFPKKIIKRNMHLNLLEVKKSRFHIISAIHPLIKSDEIGKYLFFNKDFTAEFYLKEKLCQHTYKSSYIYEHRWSSFDLVISNNFKTNHKRETLLNPGQSFRTMTRVHIA